MSKENRESLPSGAFCLDSTASTGSMYVAVNLPRKQTRMKTTHRFAGLFAGQLNIIAGQNKPQHNGGKSLLVRDFTARTVRDTLFGWVSLPDKGVVDQRVAVLAAPTAAVLRWRQRQTARPLPTTPVVKFPGFELGTHTKDKTHTRLVEGCLVPVRVFVVATTRVLVLLCGAGFKAGFNSQSPGFIIPELAWHLSGTTS